MRVENNFEGISNIVSANNLKKEIEKNSKQNTSEKTKVNSFDTVEIHTSKKLEGYNTKLRDIQATISQKQAYLKGLNQASKILMSNKDIETLYVELIKAAQKHQFNKKSLLKNIIPSSKEFYKSVKNINKLKNIINTEIKNISGQLNLTKKELSKTLVSIENVNASFSSKEIGDLKKLLTANNLFKNMNKESIIALVK